MAKNEKGPYYTQHRVESGDMGMAVLDRITSTLNYVETSKGGPMRWFFCFGTLLEYIADMTFKLDFDIDIGVLYDEYEPSILIAAMEGNGYRLDSRVINDITGKPLNMHFRPTGDLEGTPVIDVYCWYRHKGILYHTYDTKKEGREKPSQYVFKGAPEHCITPPADVVASMRRTAPAWEQMLDHNGVWHYPVFGDHSGYEFLCPYGYGELLDNWYRNWRFRQYYRGTSLTRYEHTMSSCKGWGKI